MTQEAPLHPSSRLAAIRDFVAHWRGRISFAILDQGFSSTANFLFVVLLANILPIESFGFFSVVWTISLLAEVVTTSLVADPLVELLGRRQGASPQAAAAATESLRASALWVYLALAGAVSVAIAAFGLVALTWSAEFGSLLLCLAIVSPIQRVHALIRRLCYLADRQAVAALAGGSFAATLFVLSAVLALTHLLTSLTALLALAAASMVVVGIGIAHGIIPARRVSRADLIADAQAMLRSGRWMLPANIVHWFSGQGVIPMVAAVAGPAAGGVVRALINIYSPVYQANGAIIVAFSHKFLQAVARSDLAQLRRLGFLSVTPLVILAAGYCAVLLTWPAEVLGLIYGKPEIVAAAPLVWPLAIGVLIDAASQGTGVGLLALGRTRTIFTIRLVSLAVFVASGLVLAPLFGTAGVLWAIVASIATVAALSSVALLRATQPAAGAVAERLSHTS
ncbi:lipopolysaccharide biosynthesis protein [Blastochloris tepida]|uniref:Uncharacterized protein n=1 Tax=Blastochloris tepida TaxID=2233851 RepID=A0A348FZ89_9HYPH|nr:hypothetical protein [Blastochloris tepida]BBF92622.1 hypothetical protein BLTE_13070 [Blastochloris tepida]